MLIKKAPPPKVNNKLPLPNSIFSQAGNGACIHSVCLAYIFCYIFVYFLQIPTGVQLQQIQSWLFSVVFDVSPHAVKACHEKSLNQTDLATCGRMWSDQASVVMRFFGSAYVLLILSHLFAGLG